jgi:hypothetical protein
LLLSFPQHLFYYFINFSPSEILSLKSILLSNIPHESIYIKID